MFRYHGVSVREEEVFELVDIIVRKIIMLSEAEHRECPVIGDDDCVEKKKLFLGVGCEALKMLRAFKVPALKGLLNVAPDGFHFE